MSKVVGFYSEGRGRRRKVRPITQRSAVLRASPALVHRVGESAAHAVREKQGVRDLEAEVNRVLDEAASMKSSEVMLTNLRKYSGMLGEYSPTNAVLILLQKPDATLVRSRADWERLGYELREDAKKIVVIVPYGVPHRLSKVELADLVERRIREGKSEEEIHKEVSEKLKEAEREKATHVFGLGSVYDASSVKGGRPIEEEEKYRLSELYEAGKRAAEKEFEVEEGTVAEARGYTWIAEHEVEKGKKYKIRVMRVPSEHVEPLHTLFHEMAHAYLDHVYDNKTPRPVKEQEAELAAYLVLAHFGVDDIKHSAAYISSWRSYKAADRSNIERAMKAASWIIAAVKAQLVLEEKKGNVAAEARA